jgi:phenylacetate-coenzyme A ligase PaaK-like adenylate-forming protein
MTSLGTPITTAYAFTDYHSQGQIIACVIVNIARPPSGGITNVYVALSRSSEREPIQLLRDFKNKLFTKTPCEKLNVGWTASEEEQVNQEEVGCRRGCLGLVV